MKIQVKKLKDENKYIFWVNRQKAKKTIRAILMGLILAAVLTIAVLYLLSAVANAITPEQEILSPLPSVKPSPSPGWEEPEATESAKKQTFWTGYASWYSVDGCIGCNKDRIMANGQKLQDNKKTVAFNRLPLGSIVKIRNMENDMITTAEVTDTGGFERLGKIVDLTPAVRDAISCWNCKVRVYKQ